MKTLVCPLGGSSTRYPPDLRPKWKNTVFGKMMITQAIRICNLDVFDKIIFIVNGCQKEYIPVLQKENLLVDVIVEKDTISEPEAVYRGLKTLGVKSGGVLIRDCDSLWKLPTSVNWGRNWIAVNDLHNIDFVNARNKSYVKIDSNNTVGNISEKKIISSLFNVGGYYFKSIKDFNYYYKMLEGTRGLYVSDVIYKMLLDKQLFFSETVTGYVDLGTWEDMLRFKTSCRNTKSIVVDVDKTIFEKKKDEPYSCVKPINKMVEFLRRKQEQGFYIILFTSRNMNSFNNNLGLINKYTTPVLVEALNKYGIPFDELFMGKPWQGVDGFILDDKLVSLEEIFKK